MGGTPQCPVFPPVFDPPSIFSLALCLERARALSLSLPHTQTQPYTSRLRRGGWGVRPCVPPPPLCPSHPLFVSSLSFSSSLSLSLSHTHTLSLSHTHTDTSRLRRGGWGLRPCVPYLPLCPSHLPFFALSLSISLSLSFSLISSLSLSLSL